MCGVNGKQAISQCTAQSRSSSKQSLTILLFRWLYHYTEVKLEALWTSALAEVLSQAKLWDVTLCSLVHMYRCLKGTWCLHHRVKLMGIRETEGRPVGRQPPSTGLLPVLNTVRSFPKRLVRADSHYTSRFRSVAERHRSVKFSHVYLNGDVHTDRNVSVTSQFRSVAVAERKCMKWRNGSEPVWTFSIPIMWTVLPLTHYTSECLLATSAACFFFRNGWKINSIGV